MRAVIIEDEVKNREILATLLKEFCTDVEVVGYAASVQAAISLLTKEKPDLAFLDIEIENGTSFEVLQALPNLSIECIFTTAYNHYAIKAFKYNAIDYLLKPINIDELVIAVEKAKLKVSKNQLTNQLSYFLASVKKKTPEFSKLGITNNQELEFIELNEIIYLEAEGGYTKFVLKNNKKMVSTKNIKEYEDILDETLFCRIHNSYIINLNSIKKYIKGRGGYVVMENGQTIEVSARKKQLFMNKF